MNGLVSVTEITRLYDIAPGHLYVLAHRRKWRRIKYDGRVYYRLVDVDQELGASA